MYGRSKYRQENSEVKDSILFVHNETDQALSVRDGYDMIRRKRGFESLEAFRLEPEQYKMVIIDKDVSETGSDLADGFMRIKPDVPIVLLKEERLMKPDRILSIANMIDNFMKRKKKSKGITSSLFLIH